MKINLRITVEKNSIKLEYISTLRRGEKESPNLPSWNKVSSSIHQHLDKLCKEVYGQEIVVTPTQFNQEYKGLFLETRCVYELPEDPLQALVFYWHFIAASLNDYNEYYFQDQRLSHGKEDLPVLILHWLNGLCAISKDMPNYQSVNQALTTFHSFYLSNRKIMNPLVAVESVFNRQENIVSILEPAPGFLEQYFNKDAHFKKLLSVASSALASQNDSKINYVKYLLWAYRQQQFNRFYEENCKDKVACDGENYQKDHTELAVLQYGKFRIDDNKALSLVDIADNRAYQRYYAPGKKLESDYEKEMRHLFKTAGLSLTADNGWRETINFDSQASTKLLEYNFQLDFAAIHECVNIVQGKLGFFEKNNPRAEKAVVEEKEEESYTA